MSGGCVSGRIALDRCLVSWSRRVRIETKLSAGAPLSQQIPALIEQNLKPAHTRSLVLVEAVLLFGPLIEALLLIGKLPDLVKYLAFVHAAPNVA
jgi:hypothetical protein